MKRILILLVIVLVGANFGYAQKMTAKQRKEQKEQQIKELIDNSRFSFVAQSVLPMSGPKIDLTSYYFLSVDSMMVESWLPFFGRAYHVEYGSTDGGIKFKEKADRVSIQYDEKKKLYHIYLDVTTEKESYKIHISAGIGGSASMGIISNNRQSVSYFGVIEPFPEKKEK